MDDHIDGTIVKIDEEKVEHKDITSAKLSNLSNPIDHLIRQYVLALENRNKDYTPIHVDEIASKVAKFYELIRKVIDWKEDNILRRSAIERILKRLLFTKISGLSFASGLNEKDVAEIVTLDLIRGGHLPNDKVPREHISQLAISLSKYFYILKETSFADNDPLNIKKKLNFYTFILEIAACEIEDILTNPVKENNLLLTMSQMLNDRIRIVPSTSLSDEEKYTQIYISVCRTLYDLDDSIITYHLFKYQYPNWSNPSKEFIEQLQKQIFQLWDQTEQILNHPLQKDFSSVSERIDTVFTLIGDYLEEYKDNPSELLEHIRNKDEFIASITKYYDKRYITLKKRLFRLAIFSTLSVFLSNGFTFFLIEVPMAEWFFEGFSLFTTLVDFIVPSVIMFLLVSIIRPPSASNKDKVKEMIVNYVYAGGTKEYVEIYAHKKRHSVIMFTVVLLYTLLTLATFYLVGWVFYIAHLPFTSVVFDTFTIALTIFAAVMIRNKSKELSVDDKVHAWDFFLDMISVPVAKIGSFFAAKWKEYNIFAIFFNFFIETPFAIFLDFIEGWSQFLKERRAELH